MSGLASDSINPKAGNIPKSSLSYNCIQVNTITLDSLIEKSKIDQNDIALIKIDVERMEADVLMSGKSTLLKGHPPILFEANSLELLFETKKVLDELGYNHYEKISERDYIAKKKS